MRTVTGMKPHKAHARRRKPTANGGTMMTTSCTVTVPRSGVTDRPFSSTPNPLPQPNMTVIQVPLVAQIVQMAQKALTLTWCTRGISV